MWTEDCSISNFADDTQSMSVAESKEEVIEKTVRDANNIINFFGANDLVNNEDKACVVYNSKGKGQDITLEDIGGVKLVSLNENQSEKLLGVQVSSDFTWKSHVDKLIVELNKRMGLMRRMRNKIPRGKLLMIAESIFNSKIRYAIALYLNPVYEDEEVKARTLSGEASRLQKIQNKMLRMVFGYKLQDKVNMEKLREHIQMLSVNQMNIYHVLVEAFNVINFGSSEKIQEKWLNSNVRVYSNRRQNNIQIPRVKHVKCQGFSWHGAKLWNKLPESIKSIQKPSIFKTKIKDWIWETIPAF